MIEAMKKEVPGLLQRGTFAFFLCEYILPDANVLPGPLSLAIKSNHDGAVKFKARFIIGGHRGKLKILSVHSSQALQPLSVRMLLSQAAVHRLAVRISDVIQAFLQSDHPLSPVFFLRSAPPEFTLLPEQCLQLLMPL